MKKRFKFQIKNGHLFEGSFEIAINDYVAEIEETDITIAIEHVIEAHGGQEIKEGHGRLKATSEFINEVEFEVKNDSASS